MGRFWTAFLIIGVLAVGVMFFLAGESASTAGARFMAALDARDVNTLTDMSYVEGMSKEQVAASWKKCMDQTEYYRFDYVVKIAESPTPEQSLVRLGVTKNPGAGGYEENFTLKMLRKDGKWKVDVATLNRDFYPFLPRFTSADTAPAKA